MKPRTSEATNKGDSMSDKITHIAGPAAGVHLKGDPIIRVIQRCLVCGEKLLEKKVHKERNRGASTWDAGSWIERQKDGTYHCVLPDDQIGGCSPPNTCSVLVESEDDVVTLMPEDDILDGDNDDNARKEENGE